MSKEQKEILKWVKPFCHKIIKGKKHIKCYPLKGDEVIVISSTSSDRKEYLSVRRDFKRCGIILPDFR